MWPLQPMVGNGWPLQPKYSHYSQWLALIGGTQSALSKKNEWFVNRELQQQQDPVSVASRVH